MRVGYNGPRLRALGLIEGDPGPVPKRYNPDPPRFPSDRAIGLEECLQARWRELVDQVRGSGDKDAWTALSRFHTELQAWLSR